MKARIKYQTPVCIQGGRSHTHARVRVPTGLPRGKGISFVERQRPPARRHHPANSSHHLRRLRKKRGKGATVNPLTARQSKANKALMGVSHVSSGSLGTPSPGSPANHPRIPHTTTRPGAWTLITAGQGCACTRAVLHPAQSARVQCAPPPLPARLHVLRDAGQATAQAKRPPRPGMRSTGMTSRMLDGCWRRGGMEARGRLNWEGFSCRTCSMRS